MQIKAAVLYEANTPLVVEDVELDDPKEGEVLVRLASAGVCHSDYHVMKGEWKPPLPIVLGHEAAGVVERVGPGVSMSKPGDHVILNFRPNCGWCRYCSVGRPVLCNGADTDRWVMFDGTSRLHKGTRDLYHFARTASFAEYVVVPQSGAVPVREDMPLDKACLIGCSVMTGVGSVVNTAKVEPGSSVVVIGCGGVGLNVIQGAALAGAGRIIAVDVLVEQAGLRPGFRGHRHHRRQPRRHRGPYHRHDRRRRGLRFRSHRQPQHHPPGVQLHLPGRNDHRRRDGRGG